MGAAFGASAFGTGDAGLVKGPACGGQQRDRCQCGYSHADLVSSDEFGSAVRAGILARADRKMIEMTPDVLRELLDGGVTALRLLAQCHENNIVEIASQAFAELFGGAFARRAYCGSFCLPY